MFSACAFGEMDNQPAEKWTSPRRSVNGYYLPIVTMQCLAASSRTGRPDVSVVPETGRGRSERAMTTWWNEIPPRSPRDLRHSRRDHAIKRRGFVVVPARPWYSGRERQ